MHGDWLGSFHPDREMSWWWSSFILISANVKIPHSLFLNLMEICRDRSLTLTWVASAIVFSRDKGWSNGCVVVVVVYVMKQPNPPTTNPMTITSKKLWWFLHANRHRLELLVSYFSVSLTVGELGFAVAFWCEVFSFLEKFSARVAVTF